MGEFEIPFPIRGLDDTWAFANQPPKTTRDSSNMRAKDPLTGSLRGAQRSGLEKFNPYAATRNYLSYTTTFDTAAWVLNANTVDVGYEDPYGGTTACNISSGPGAVLYADLGEEATIYRIGDTKCVASFTVKQAGSGKGRLLLQQTQGNGTSAINQQIFYKWEGTVATQTGQTSAGDGFKTYGIKNLGGGWYQVYVGIEYSATRAGSTLRVEFVQNNEPGSAVNSTYVYCPQFEFGTVPTTPLPVVGANTTSRTNRIQHLTSATIARKALVYSESAESTTPVWSSQNPSKTDCKRIATDDQENVYALDGNAVAKYNSEGTLLWQTALPTDDQDHALEVLYVDSSYRVFVGISSGGEQSKAKVWKIDQEDDNKTSIGFTIDIDGFVTEIEVRGEQMFLLIEDRESNKGYFEVYSSIASTSPDLDLVKQVPYPANGMAVQDDLSVITTHEPSSYDATWGTGIRGEDPKHEGTYPITYGWNPKDLTDWEKRIWAWYDADQIDESDMKSGVLEEGASVARFRDISGNGRHFTDAIDDDPDRKLPTLRMDGLSGRKTLKFNGEDQKLWSGFPIDSKEANKNASRSALPAYQGSAFAVFMVVRPSWNQKGAIMGMFNSGAATPHRLGFMVNATDNATMDSTIGSVAVHEHTAALDTGAATSGQPKAIANQHTSLNQPQGMLISYINDGNNGTDGDDGVSDTGATHSCFRVNGEPIDRWTSLEFYCTTADNSRTHLGHISGATGPTGWYEGEICEIIVLDKYSTDSADGLNLVIDHNPTAENGSEASTNGEPPTDFEKMEAYLMYKWGLQHNIFKTAGGGNTHPYGKEGVNAGYSTGMPYTTGWDPNDLNSSGSIVAKWAPPLGVLKWAQTRTYGTGFGVEVKDDGVYCVGPGLPETLNNVGKVDGIAPHVRKLKDNGSTVAISGEGAWGHIEEAAFTSPSTKYQRLTLDSFGNVYWPAYDTVRSVFTVRILKAADGTLKRDFDTATDVTRQNAYQVALPPYVPEYENASVTLPEFMYVATPQNSFTGTGETRDTIWKVRLTETSHISDSPRETKMVLVSRGEVYELTRSAQTQLTGASLDPAASFVDSLVLFQKVFLIDGSNKLVYDPKAGTLVEWKATSGGKIPSRPRLACAWRGRPVLARDPDDPHNWYMGAKDDPFNWDLFPPVIRSTQAVAGNTSRAGKLDDIVNALIPYNDDLLIIGGDHTINIMRGDPMAGGQIDLVTDITGISFGRPWTKDPYGTLYFHGTKGGIFRMRPGGMPEPMTRDRIARRIADIDLAAYRVELHWNTQDEGLHVFQIPYAKAGIAKHWFWEQQTDAWWQDEFSSAFLEPTAALLFDGDDPDDRKLLLAGQDRIVREWSRTAQTDDGYNIVSDVLLGPLLPPGEHREARFGQLQTVLAYNQGGVEYDLFVSDTSDNMGDPFRSGELSSGRNPRSMNRMRGASCWVRYYNGGASRWAHEVTTIKAWPAGRKRQR